MKKIFLLIIFLLAAHRASAQDASNPLGGDIRASSTNCSVTSSCVWQKLPANATSLTVTIANGPVGSFTGTLQFEQSSNGGFNFSAASPASTTIPGVFTFTVTTFTDFRVRASAFASGDAAVNMQASGPATGPPGPAGPPGQGGSSVSPNSPLPQATSGPGPVFNVANYTGAFHDTRSNTFCDTSITINQVTCSTINGVLPFTVADVGKRFNCDDGTNGLDYPAGTTITSFISGNVVQLSQNRTFSNSGEKCTWGHPDDVALVAAFSAAILQATAFGGQNVGNTSAPIASPTIYLPAGGWMVCQPSSGLPIFNFLANRKGFKIKGDGFDITYLYNCDATSVMSANGYWIGNTNMSALTIEDLTIDGGNIPVNTSGGFTYAIYGGVQTFLNNVHLQGVSANGGAQFQGLVTANNFIVNNTVGTAILCSACNGEFRNSGASNSGTNLIIQNVTGSNTGEGLRWIGGLIDETGSNIPTQIVNSHDVWFIGTAGFGTNTKTAMSVDGTSFVHITGGIWGVFGNDTNAGGVTVAAGGAVQASDVRFISSGTGKCINNSGVFNDNGGNSCESMFPIASGTSTGTAAVLTVTTLGANANTNCTIGDSLLVQGASPLGYNGYYPFGITAVAAGTISYTTAGSNLGAATAVGSVTCRNLQTYAGTLPKALLNNPIPNTCYVTITPIVNATTYTLCNFRAQSATNITRIMASSQVVTTCATAPIITISDGTATQTLTLTTAKQSWDSSVDASTGVGTTIFKPNGTITVKYDVAAASACATPPTQLAISYNISPILSN